MGQLNIRPHRPDTYSSTPNGMPEEPAYCGNCGTRHLGPCRLSVGRLVQDPTVAKPGFP